MPSEFETATTLDQALDMIRRAEEVKVWARDNRGNPVGFPVSKDSAIEALQVLGAGLPKVERTDDNRVWIG